MADETAPGWRKPKGGDTDHNIDWEWWLRTKGGESEITAAVRGDSKPNSVRPEYVRDQSMGDTDYE